MSAGLRTPRRSAWPLGLCTLSAWPRRPYRRAAHVALQQRPVKVACYAVEVDLGRMNITAER
eukprot:5694647-Pleurochrysis_carterae.AAC.1